MMNWMRPELLETTVARLAASGYDAIELSGEPDVYEPVSVALLEEQRGGRRRERPAPPSLAPPSVAREPGARTCGSRSRRFPPRPRRVAPRLPPPPRGRPPPPPAFA